MPWMYLSSYFIVFFCQYYISEAWKSTLFNSESESEFYKQQFYVNTLKVKKFSVDPDKIYFPIPSL